MASTDARPQRRLNININEYTAAALLEYRDENGVTVTETVRRAVAMLLFVHRELRAGNRLQIVEAGGARRDVEVL